MNECLSEEKKITWSFGGKVYELKESNDIGNGMCVWVIQNFRYSQIESFPSVILHLKMIHIVLTTFTSVTQRLVGG